MAKLMIRFTVSLAVVLMVAGPAFATHRPDHQEPPACEKSQGQAQQHNKHCYPPASNAQEQETQKKASFATPAPEGPGITVGMIAVAGLAGAGTLMLIRRRRFQSLR